MPKVKQFCTFYTCTASWAQMLSLVLEQNYNKWFSTPDSCVCVYMKQYEASCNHHI